MNDQDWGKELADELHLEDRKNMNLATKLCEIMRLAGKVEKTGHNSFSNYDYIEESFLASKMQKLFCRYKVFVLSSVLSYEEQQVTNSKGKVQMHSTCMMEYTLINGDKPEEQYKVQAAGAGMDVGDKGLYKALTGAHKYFLIRNFNLGGDTEAEQETPSMGVSEPQKAEAPKEDMF